MVISQWEMERTISDHGIAEQHSEGTFCKQFDGFKTIGSKPWYPCSSQQNRWCIGCDPFPPVENGYLLRP
jgi:hypothetical protein